MKKIPVLLIWLRLCIGIVIIGLSILHPPFFRPVIITLITIGLVSDVLDGIIARRLGVSTEKLRRLDSAIDMAFWLMVIIAVGIVAPTFMQHNYILMVIVAVCEASAYLLSYAKFGKEVATHAILSKIWVLTIFSFLIQVIATGDSGILFYICCIIGIITRFEIILILLILKKWTNDVPSLYHAVLIRQGKPIKRSKWFNG